MGVWRDQLRTELYPWCLFRFCSKERIPDKRDTRAERLLLFIRKSTLKDFKKKNSNHLYQHLSFPCGGNAVIYLYTRFHILTPYTTTNWPLTIFDLASIHLDRCKNKLSPPIASIMVNKNRNKETKKKKKKKKKNTYKRIGMCHC